MKKAANTLASFLIFASLFVGYAVSSGCETLSDDQTQALIAQSQATIEQLKKDIAAERARAATIEDEAERERVIERIARMESAVIRAEQARDAFLAARQPDGSVDPVGGAIGAISTFLPPPFNVLAPTLGAIGVGVVGWMRERKKATALVGAIETAREVDPSFNQAFKNPNTKLALETMGPAAKKIVDTVQRKRRAAAKPVAT